MIPERKLDFLEAWQVQWRLLIDKKTDVYWNLAIDEALARQNANSEKKSCTLRFWNTDKAVVIGRFQCVHEEVNMSFCKKKGIAIARRFTGGGAVYHDLGNLNFTICGDQRDPSVSKNLMEFYGTFIGAVSKSLRLLGVAANYDEDRACIRIGGKKVTGTAGWIKQGVSFLHGTLLLEADLEMLKESLNPPKGQPVYLRDSSRIRCKPSRRDNVTNLLDEMEEVISINEAQDAIIASLQEVTGADFTQSDLTPEERGTSQALYQSRYSQSDWNLGTPLQT